MPRRRRVRRLQPGDDDGAATGAECGARRRHGIGRERRRGDRRRCRAARRRRRADAGADQLDIDRPLRRRAGGGDQAVEFGGRVGLGQRALGLDQRPHHGGLVEALMAGMRLVRLVPIGQHQQRRAVECGGGDAVHRIGEAWAARGHQHAQRAGQLRRGGRHDRRRGLGAGDDEIDAVPRRGLDQVEAAIAAGDAEEALHAMRGEALGEHLDDRLAHSAWIPASRVTCAQRVISLLM